MENKNLLWRDYQIKWPKTDYIFLDTAKNINNLEELSILFHAMIEVRKDGDNLDCSIVYHKNGHHLISTNCTIVLIYSGCGLEKVKLKSKDDILNEEEGYGNN